MTELETLRSNPLIDPALHIWGWQIPVYLFLGGMTAGVMIVAAAAARRVPVERQSRAMRLAIFAAPVLLSAGMLALLLDLESKLHVFRFYTAFRLTSPMSWGSWILLAIYPATILFGLARLTPGEVASATRWPGVRAVRAGAVINKAAAFARERGEALGRANVVLGVALGAYTGILLGTLAARALWSSLLLAPLFLVSGFSTGAALLMLLPLAHDEHKLLRDWDVRAIALELLLLAMYFADLASDGGERGRAAVAMFFGGSFTATFWALVVIGGLAVPLLLEWIEKRRRIHPSVLAPVLLLLGGLALRWILVIAGQAHI